MENPRQMSGCETGEDFFYEINGRVVFIMNPYFDKTNVLDWDNLLSLEMHLSIIKYDLFLVLNIFRISNDIRKWSNNLFRSY